MVFTCWPVKPARCYKEIDMSYQQYEIFKAEWIRKNPNSTPEQYQIAMRKIAKLCKV